MTFERVRVGDVLSLQRRAVDIEPDSEYEEIGVRSFGRGIFHKEPVSGASLGAKRVFRIVPGDLVISNVFAWEGAIAVASEAETGRIGSHRFMTFVPADCRVSTSWASWFFRSEPGLDLIRQASPGSAGRNRTLAIDRFQALQILLPPIDRQHLIAEQLDRLEAAVRDVGQRDSRAMDLSRALATSVTARLDLSAEAKARAGWRLATLGDVVKPSTSQVQVDPSQHYRIAGIYSFGRGLINRGVMAGSETSYKTFTILNEGNVVVSKLGGWEGAVAVVQPSFRGFCVSSEFPTFTIDRSKMVPAFFSGITRSPWFWQQIDSGTRGSMARRKRIAATDFLRARFWMPSLEDQRQIATWLQIADRADRAREMRRSRTEALVPAAVNKLFASDQ